MKTASELSRVGKFKEGEDPVAAHVENRWLEIYSAGDCALPLTP